MNSATSIEGLAGAKGKVQRPREEAGFRPWHFFVLASLLAATAAVVLARQSTPEHLVFISVTIGAAGAAAAGFYRMLAPLAAEDARSFSEPLTDRQRAALEREKTLVLRSIKELEFDRAMGKLSPKDFEEMSGRLRARALSLMKELEASGSGYREIIERELKARLEADRGSARLQPDNSRGRDERPPLPGVPVRADHTCACGTTNDADAVFCKRCGTRLS